LANYEEIYLGAVVAGKAPVEVVHFPDSSKSFRLKGRSNCRFDYYKRVVPWLEHNALGEGAEGE
jgi:hypothetical protein